MKLFQAWQDDPQHAAKRIVRGGVSFGERPSFALQKVACCEELGCQAVAALPAA